MLSKEKEIDKIFEWSSYTTKWCMGGWREQLGKDMCPKKFYCKCNTYSDHVFPGHPRKMVFTGLWQALDRGP